MTSTKIITNADALSRAADAILARGPNPSKNAILNALAAAIAGDGHDWGFIKNAPKKTVVQPGLDAAASAQPAPATVWVLHYDEQNDWGPGGQVFATREAALDHIRHDPWWQGGGHDAETVIAEILESGCYTFTHDADAEIDDEDGDYDYGEPYRIDLFEAPVQAVSTLITAPAKPAAPALLAICDPDDVTDSAVRDIIAAADLADQQGITVPALLQDLPAGYIEVAKHSFTASFLAQAWMNDLAIPVDPEGETDWIIIPEDLDASQQDFDYLRHSTHAPAWVRDWTGPFEVILTVE